MRSLKKCFVAFAIFSGICISTAHGTEFFSDQGSMWFSGEFNFAVANDRTSSDNVNMVLLDPTIRFFPARYFFIGPHFQWLGDYSKNYSMNRIAIGPEIGLAIGNMPVIPYGMSSILYTHQSNTSTYTSNLTNSISATQTHTSGADGYILPISTGMMIPIFDNIGLQFEIGYAYNHSYSYTYRDNSNQGVFFIAFGVCGIGKAAAISVMNLFTNLMF
jgi:hypothetical protein